MAGVHAPRDLARSDGRGRLGDNPLAHIATEEVRGEQARQVLENPIYKESFAVIEERLINELAMADTKAERAEHLRTIRISLRKSRAYLEQVLMSGKLAGMESERKNTLADKAINRFKSVVNYQR